MSKSGRMAEANVTEVNSVMFCPVSRSASCALRTPRGRGNYRFTGVPHLISASNCRRSAGVIVTVRCSTYSAKAIRDLIAASSA